MQKFEKNDRLLHLYDTEKGHESWLRRHSLVVGRKGDVEYVLDCEARGAIVPLTRRQIEELFMGPDVEYDQRLGRYFKIKSTSGRGICYHPTPDPIDIFFRLEAEAPAIAHVLWQDLNDEINICSIAVDSDFPFRQLMYHVLIDELKSFIMKAVGYEFMEKITTILSVDQQERRFYESQHFRVVEVPGESKIVCWLPEYQGLQKENRWTQQEKKAEGNP